jgi:hypothetical protein
MKFGIFMAPFHKVGENPALAFERDLQLKRDRMVEGLEVVVRIVAALCSAAISAIRRTYTVLAALDVDAKNRPVRRRCESHREGDRRLPASPREGWDEARRDFEQTDFARQTLRINAICIFADGRAIFLQGSISAYLLIF